MAKLPFMKFYPTDWIGATRALTHERRGAYMVLLCHLWINAPKGEMTFLWDDLAALWHCTVTEASLIVTSLRLNNCIEVTEMVLSGDIKAVKILQKRIMRDKKEYESHAFRQKKYRVKTRRLSDGDGDAKVTPKKSEVRSQNTTPIVPKGDERFASFWKAYPRKVGKGAAEKAWSKIPGIGALLEKVLTAVASQRRSPQWSRDGGQFIPHPATWLNQRRWEDEGFGISKDKIVALKPVSPETIRWKEDYAADLARKEQARQNRIDQVVMPPQNPPWPPPFAIPALKIAKTELGGS